MNKLQLLIFLEELKKRPNSALSQNFLVDDNIAAKIVKTAAVSPGDTVLEIGSGPGTLTEHLLEKGARVFAVETDSLFAKELLRFQTPDERLIVFHADILKFDLSTLPSPIKVVANLPYHITTPIFEHLLEKKELFSSFTLMVQKELAERLLAKPSTKEYGSLTLFLQFHTQISASFSVSASCFYPKPKVDSKVLRFDILPSRNVESAPFFSLVRRAFQQRRKMLRASLKSLYPAKTIEEALANIHLPTDARPETLSLDAWIAFYNLLIKKTA